jgi:hypothetical protein
MHHGYDQIGAMVATGALNIQAHLLILAPGDTRLVHVGFEAARKKLVVPQQRDAQAMTFNQ